jgi:hypothetical protein
MESGCIGLPTDHRSAGGLRVARCLRIAVAAVAGALLVYLAWRGYQQPDLLLDLAAFRLC